MKVSYTSADGRLTFETEADKQQDLFEAIASFQEVFENDASALINGNLVTANDIKFIVREAEFKDEKGKTKKANYYEKRVVSGPMRGYKKEYGQYEDGSGLFPKRAPKENAIQGDNDWYRYVKPGN